MPPGEPCIWSRTGCYDWKEAYAQTNRYAQFFLEHGVQPDELAAFYLTNSPEFMLAMMGLWAVGAAPAMINYHLTGDALVHCVRVSGAKIILVDWDNECRQRIEDERPRLENELAVKIIILDDTTKAYINQLLPTRPPNHLRDNMKPEFPMSLLFTSGSTGHPKAVSFSVSRGVHLAGPRGNSLGVKQGPGGDTWYVCMPMYHGTGCTTAVGCMLDGITLAIGKKFSTSGFWTDIRDSNATVFTYVGETARYLLSLPESPKDKQHKVRIMFGNGMRPDVWHRFVERYGIDTVAEFFNSTEGVFGLLNVSRGPYLAACVGHHGALLRFLMRNYYVAAEIDHDTGDLWRDPRTGFGKRNRLEDGGEIIVGVPNESLFPGYWRNKDATDKKFVRDLFKKGDLWYRTGDALRRTRDGRWFFMDRLGDTFRWKSENVATAEVSEVLGHFPGLAEAIVYGTLVPGHDGRAGCAAVHLAPSHSPTPQFFSDLLRFSLSKLPRYAVPVFLRLQPGATPMHNQKQNKVPLKKEGIDLDAIYGVGKDFKDAKEEGRDLMYFWPSALGHPDPGLDGETYVPFERKDWEDIKAQRHVKGRVAGVKAKM
jgi:acyl-CoA synthetase (AMP-forming)/AMP-acid ligase II